MSVQAPTNTITVYPNGVRIQVTPGDQLTFWPEQIPLPSHATVGVFEWVRNAQGSYDPMVRIHPKMIRCGEAAITDLGLGIGYYSLRRLCRGGFVRWQQITPGQYAFDLQSYYQHLAKVQADPEFWTGKNLKKYMEAI